MTALADLTRYELDAVARAYEQQAREFPEAGGLITLRGVATSTMSWDQRQPSCWDDPEWLASFQFIRAHVKANLPDPVDAVARDVVPILHALAAARRDLG